MKKCNTTKVIKREVCVGDNVPILNSRLKVFIAKLKYKWLGPFIVTNVYLSRDIELDDDEKKMGSDCNIIM